MKKNIISYVVAVVVSVGLILLVCGTKGVLTSHLTQQEIIKYVCDGFFVAAVVLLGMGGLTWASGQGTFDGLGYTFSLWKEKFTNHKKDWHKREDFQEYKERKAEKKKNRKINHFLVMGGVLMIVAAILMIVYNFAF